MALKYTAKTEKEIQEEKNMPEGEYSFEISGAEDYVSKAGNEMIKLTVRVFKPDGSFNLVDDYLTEKMLYKILHLCEAVNMQEKYASGVLEPEDFIGKQGKLKLVIQEGKDGYSDRNSIKDYITDASADIPKDALEKTIKGDDDFSDEIPDF